MNKPNLSRLAQSFRTTVVKHSPEILTAFGVAGMLTTTVLAVKATPKALKLIEAKKEYEQVDKLTPIETIKTCWRCYVPAAITGTVSAACLFGACSVNARRNAALATAYKISETALAEYKDKVVETIGEKKERAIRDEIDKDRLEKNPVKNGDVIFTSRGNTLCYDYHSGRYFRSDIEHIKRAINNINARLLKEDYISLNDFYDEIDLENTKLGNDLGWRVDKGLVDVRFGSQLTPDGEPCLVITFTVEPLHDYWKFA